MPQRNCIYSLENAPKYYVLEDDARSRPGKSGGDAKKIVVDDFVYLTLVMLDYGPICCRGQEVRYVDAKFLFAYFNHLSKMDPKILMTWPLYNAYTTGTDVFWAGLPILSLSPKKMATRVASSLCLATGLGDDMIISKYVFLTSSYEGISGEGSVIGTKLSKVQELTNRLKVMRLSCPLCDIARWVLTMKISALCGPLGSKGKLHHELIQSLFIRNFRLFSLQILFYQCMPNTRSSGQPLLPINPEPQLIGRMEVQRDIERRAAQQEQDRLAALAAAQVHQQNIDNPWRATNPEVVALVNRRDRQARLRPERRAVQTPFDDDDDDLDGSGATGAIIPPPLEPGAKFNITSTMIQLL
ncbi:hypothetical protein CQW23_12288 [Capsicum baccatum]|uniref:O-GlcNAc transferase C-terminal domain-containing protein n=1 Tax=Capsicum baccatum TaxID=33114 RepID=A0A2G2WSD2_CAPBA|nr:hypothetical protein CQW23_12288 [Capsicum baccatum]